MAALAGTPLLGLAARAASRSAWRARAASRRAKNSANNESLNADDEEGAAELVLPEVKLPERAVTKPPVISSRVFAFNSVIILVPQFFKIIMC